jgi:hypothetical protein
MGDLEFLESPEHTQVPFLEDAIFISCSHALLAHMHGPGIAILGLLTTLHLEPLRRL